MALILTGCRSAENSLANYVDTQIGVIDNRSSNCVVDPRMPYGSIYPSPHTPDGDMGGFRPQQPIRGFCQMHVSGTGWGSYGHFMVSPLTGSLTTRVDGHDSPHSGEVTLPYYFSTQLERYGIQVEVTPCHYSAIYRFTAQQAQSLIFDATEDVSSRLNGKVLASRAHIDAEAQRVRLMITYQGGWPEKPYTVYAVGRFNRAAQVCGAWRGEHLMPEQTDIQTSELTKEHSGVYASFSEGDEPLLLKLAVSFTGYERAEALLDEEIPDWDFERVKREGQRVWDRKLSAIRIRTTDEAQKRIFYSALYRVFTLASDRSKDNARWSGTEPFWDDNYAYWDTFRSAFPLLHLVDAEASTGNVRSVLDRFRHNGEVCDGFIAGYDRHDEQGGNDIDCVLADAYLKGVKGVDWEAVYQLMKFNADHRRVGFRDAKKTVGEGYLQYKQQGWMPTNPMSTSQTLEFAYNDFCVAQVARGLGHLQDAERYEARSRQWRQLWNPSLESRGFHGFIDARNADGTFAQMDPSQRGNSWGLPLYEGTSWTYSYYMPHELDTLIQLMGGKEAFVDRLQYGFEQKMIDYSNEPGFLCARAFAHAGRPDLSSYWVHHEMREAFDLTGYPGNDDTGSMASWFVFCSMGLFPNAGQSYYYLNAPLFTESDIRLANGKRLRITANAAPNNVYIQSVRVNGKEWTSPFLPHSEIAKGGHITFVLSSSPDNSNLTH